MKVTVKQWHIDHGQKKDCNKCPIALAVAEKFPDARWIDVTRFNIQILFDPNITRKTSRHFALPQKAKAFINQFDNGFNVEPFSFNAELIK